MDWRNLYEGADIANNPQYLLRHHLESDLQYDLRVTRSTYKNYIKPVCSVWSSHIWRKAPARTIGETPIGDTLDASVVTDEGNINSFFSRVSLQSLITGVHFVYVDFDDEKQLPKFISVKPEDVINWGFDEKGLKFVTLTEQFYSSVDAYTPHTLVNRYRVIERDSYKVLQDTDGGLTVIKQGKNFLGIVPLVPFYFHKVSDMVGRSLIADVSGVIKKLFQKENELDIAEFYSCVSFLFFRGFSDEEINTFTLNPGNAVRSSFTDSSISYVEPTNKPLDQLRFSIEDLYYALHEIILRQLRTRSTMPTSYIRARLDNMQMETQLEDWSKRLADYEKQCWLIASKYANIDYSNLFIKYNDDFSIEEVESSLLSVLDALVDKKRLSKEDFTRLLQKWDLKE